jgi:hypothetical protein
VHAWLIGVCRLWVSEDHMQRVFESHYLVLHVLSISLGSKQRISIILTQRQQSLLLFLVATVTCHLG